MDVVLFGGTGMVGSGVLLECLDDDGVRSVLAVGRSPVEITHPKLTQLVHRDLFDLSSIRDRLQGRDACFFCLGISSFGKREAEYRRVTYDLTVSVATFLAGQNPGMTFCYVSGQGTDSTAHGPIMWARVKGETENRLLQMPLEAFMFRPGYIQPLRGVRSNTALYTAAYAVLAPLHPLLQRLFPRSVTTSVNVGRAMIRVARSGSPNRILENPHINTLAQD
jgi:uncharacterized protein YbjT (DUF2867 family)